MNFNLVCAVLLVTDLTLLITSCQSSAVGRSLLWEQGAEGDLEELEQLIEKVMKKDQSSSDDDRESCLRGEGELWRRTLEATLWAQSQDQLMRVKSHNLAISEWNYEINLTDENSIQYENTQNDFDTWMSSIIPKAREYLGNSYTTWLNSARTGMSNEDGSELCNKTTIRLLQRIAFSNLVPPSKDPETSKSINHLVSQMGSIFSTLNVSHNGKFLRLDPELTELMATSRDHEELKWAWLAWHDVTGPPIKPLYVQLVDKMNQAAKDNGFSNVGESWQIADFETMTLERLMDDIFVEVKPFFQQLHAFVRTRLRVKYPGANIDQQGLIPAHLLGNMWAQEWDEIFDIAAPYPEVSASRDVTAALKLKGYSVIDIFRTSEKFFTSLGLEPMTVKFWQKSVLEGPGERRMKCHGSAHDFYTSSDFRIKMCTTITAADFYTVHHEMGHIQYYMQYRHQPSFFRTGANAAFHEAVGDTIALSVVTPSHLKAINLIEKSQSSQETPDLVYKQKINYLMQVALAKVAFLPFGYTMDKWRFAVFRGDVTPDKYNELWWKMRAEYHGLKPPQPRSDEDFDPGSKYHIPNNVPYSRYFLSFIGQFQFHEALCKEAGLKEGEELSSCDIYQSKKAGDKLKSVLSLGASKPWPEIMQKFTGQSKFSVKSLLRYFQPLIRWLEKENKNTVVGWTTS